MMWASTSYSEVINLVPPTRADASSASALSTQRSMVGSWSQNEAFYTDLPAVVGRVVVWAVCVVVVKRLGLVQRAGPAGPTGAVSGTSSAKRERIAASITSPSLGSRIITASWSALGPARQRGCCCAGGVGPAASRERDLLQ
jgi:hypothetical protein